MADYSRFDFTGKVIKIIGHTGKSLMFIVKLKSFTGDLDVICHASGKTGIYLSGKIQPQDHVFGMGQIMSVTNGFHVDIAFMYRTLPGWNRDSVKTPQKSAPTSADIIFEEK